MLEDLIEERRRKLAKLQEAGIDPFPVLTPKSVPVAEVLLNFKKLERAKKSVATRGRLLAFRDQGKLIFLDLEDSGVRIQLVIKKENLKQFDLWKSVLDRGDFVYVKGVPFITKRGEKS